MSSALTPVNQAQVDRLVAIVGLWLQAMDYTVIDYKVDWDVSPPLFEDSALMGRISLLPGNHYTPNSFYFTTADGFMEDMESIAVHHTFYERSLYAKSIRLALQKFKELRKTHESTNPPL